MKLIVFTRFFTWFHLIGISFLSLGLYYAYMWVSNFLGFSYTYATIPELHETCLYYLTVFLCVGTTFIVDLFIASFKFTIFPSPSEYLRALINRKQDIN